MISSCGLSPIVHIDGTMVAAAGQQQRATFTDHTLGIDGISVLHPVDFAHDFEHDFSVIRESFF